MKIVKVSDVLEPLAGPAQSALFVKLMVITDTGQLYTNLYRDDIVDLINQLTARLERIDNDAE